MSEFRRKLMMNQEEPVDDRLIFYAPLAYNGDITDHISGNSPIIHSSGSMTWDNSVGMYKFSINNSVGGVKYYSTKWKIDDKYKDISNFNNGFTIIADIIHLSSSGNGWHGLYALPSLDIVFATSTSKQPYIYSSPFRFGNEFSGSNIGYANLGHCTTVVSWTNGSGISISKSTKWYRNGILKTSEGPSTTNMTLSEYDNIVLCQLLNNNYACTMYLKNLKLYSYPMSDEEVVNEYNNTK